MKRFYFLLLTLLTFNAFAALTEVDKAIYTERNILKNPGFENGRNSWNVSSATNNAVTTAANVLYGTASGSVLISTNGGYVRSGTYTLPTALYGQACEARVLYKGGDALTTLEVYNRDNELQGSQVLVANADAGYKSVFFRCPTATQVAGDADKGALYVQIKQTSAGTHTIMYTDNWYLGTLLNLGDTTLPDVYSAKISSTDVVSEENVDWINGNCTNATAGQATCNFNASIFASTPTCTVSTASNNVAFTITGTVSTSSILVISYDTTGTGVNVATNITCVKSGTDAKQAVQVYKTIPKIADNIDRFTAKISSADVVSAENVDWITGDCTNATAGVFTCNINAGVFGLVPNCQVTPGAGTSACIINNTSTNTQITGVCYVSNTGTNTNTEVILSCDKQGTDFKMPTVQPVIVGNLNQTPTANPNTHYKMFSAAVGTTGTVSSEMGDWITGNCTNATPSVCTLDSSVFTATPNCFANTNDATTGSFCISNATSATSVSIRCTSDAGADTTTTKAKTLWCQGL